MNTLELNPGAGIILRGLVDEATARKVGRTVRAKVDELDLPPLYMVTDILLGKRHFFGFDYNDHADITNNVTSLFEEDHGRRELDILAIYNRSPITMLGFHADDAQDVRAIANVSEESTSIITLTGGDVPLKFETDGWLTNADGGHTIQEHELRPGDVYVINNLGLGYDAKVVHATPQNTKGRTMIRYDQQYWSWRDNTPASLVIPECVTVETIVEGVSP